MNPKQFLTPHIPTLSNQTRLAAYALIANIVGIPLAVLLGQLFPNLHPYQAVNLARYGFDAEGLSNITHSPNSEIFALLQKISNYVAAGATERFGFIDSNHLGNPSVIEECTLVAQGPDELPTVSQGSCVLIDETDPRSIVNTELGLQDLYGMRDNTFTFYLADLIFRFDYSTESQITLQFLESADIRMHIDRVTIASTLSIVHTAVNPVKEGFTISLNGTDASTGEKMQIRIYRTSPFPGFTNDYSVRGVAGTQTLQTKSLVNTVNDLVSILPFNEETHTVLTPLLDAMAENSES